MLDSRAPLPNRERAHDNLGRRAIAMPLVISLPGLLALDGDPPAPSLARLLAAGGPPRHVDDTIAAALAPLYGVHRQIDWPLAPIRAAALGVEPGDAYWLGADPVTLVPDRDDLRLEASVRDLDRDEARALVDTLNAHFAADGISFVAPRPDAWFVRAPAPQALSTHALEAARGRAVRALQPDGADARGWRRRQNEMQMLLFEHPVNLARERAGKPPANSVWLEHGGTMPSRDPSAAVRTWSADPAIGALAAFANAPAQPAPDSLAPVLAGAAHGETIVVALADSIDVARVERAFAAPARAALDRGRTDAVTIVADGRGETRLWRAQRPTAWRRWTSRFAAPDLASALRG